MTTGCDTAREFISARLDGELGSADGAVLDAHLDHCEPCRSFAAESSALQARLRLASAPPVPDLSAQILGRVGVPEPADTRRRRWPLAVAASVVAVCVAGAAVFAVGRSEEPPPDLAVADVFLGETDQIGAVYVTMINRGGSDRLVSARSARAERVSLHRTDRRSGVLVMESVTSVPVDGNSTVVLAPLGGHLMLENLSAPVGPGETVPLVLTFARSGDIEVVADVLPWSEVVARADAVPGSGL